MTQAEFDDRKISAMYLKVVKEPNKTEFEKKIIQCPRCGQKILFIPTLKIMNQAIEEHIQNHKKQLKDSPIQKHQIAIHIRLNLMTQVLKHTKKNKKAS